MSEHIKEKMPEEIVAESAWSRLGNWFNSIANPTRFMSYSAKLLPWLIGICVILFVSGLYYAFVKAPLDDEMGHSVKIMFVHVPAAWTAMMSYSVVAISSFGFLVWRHPLADVSAKAAAPIGAAITFLCLVTGSLWGKPDWGTYWQWDARLTSVLILFFLFLGLIALRNAVEDEIQAGKLTAVLALVGIVLLPIIKYSVDWWWTLHQPSGIFKGGVHTSYLIPLFLMALGYTFLFFLLHMKAMRAEVLRRRGIGLKRRHVFEAGKNAQQKANENKTLSEM